MSNATAEFRWGSHSCLPRHSMPFKLLYRVNAMTDRNVCLTVSKACKRAGPKGRSK